MALTYTPQSQNEKLPTFALKTVIGESWSSAEITEAPAKVIVFMCNHCPYIKAIEARLIRLAKKLKEKDVPFIGICANDPEEYPEDSPAELLKSWREKKYDFTYLIDETQEVARAFGAVCTPDFFVYDRHNQLRYRGRLDDSWKAESKVSRQELFEAVLNLLKGQTGPMEQIPSMGCSIKWRDS